MKRQASSGFALAEVVIALMLVGIVTALLGGLGNQISMLVRRSTQTGTILDIRSSIGAINRSPESWLVKMRSSAHTHGVYAGCIPDPNTNVNNFQCPDLLTSDQINSDENLKSLSGDGSLYVASVPMVDPVGNPLAGTIDEPLLMTNDGKVCDLDRAKCPLVSIGYMMRSEQSGDKDPGSVKFVIKLASNPTYISGGGTPMKAQYMSVDIGQAWKDPQQLSFSQNCPVGTIKIGYLSNGSPSCINPNSNCTEAGTFQIGVNSNGTAICKPLPTCSDGQGIVLNGSGTDLMCTSSSAPCGESNIFLGYFAGSGEPMCSGQEIKCESGQLQIGITIEQGKIKAQCTETPPSCAEANMRLALQGDKFVCETNTFATSCGEDEAVSGINADGSVKCSSIQRTVASPVMRCPSGQVMVGLNEDKSPLCEVDGGTPAGAVSAFAMATCPSGWLAADGSNLSTTQYPALYAAIQNVYGGSSGTFNLPDLRGEFIRGMDSGRGVDSGRVLGSFQDASRILLEWHRNSGAWQYSMTDFGAVHSNIENQRTHLVGGTGFINRTGTDTAAITTGQVRPRNVALKYCIKY